MASTEAVGQEAVGAAEASLFRRRPVVAVAGVLFWGWLVVRWLNDWLGGVLVPRGQPMIPVWVFAAPARFFAGVAAAISNLQVSLLVVAVDLNWLAAPFSWLAALFEILAFGVPYLPSLATGVWLTVVLTVTGIALGFVIAVPLAVARVYGDWSSGLSLAYIELIRGTPLLAQLFVLYYGLNLSKYFRGVAGFGGVVPATAVWVAVIGFTINSAAYQSEYIRGALESVDRGQLVAARSVGLSQLEGIRYVVLPQALRFAIPGWSNELVYLIKYSSLAAFITVPELFEIAESIASTNFKYTEIFTIVAFLYLAVVLTAANLTAWVEDRVAVPGLGTRGSR